MTPSHHGAAGFIALVHHLESDDSWALGRESGVSVGERSVSLTPTGLRFAFFTDTLTSPSAFERAGTHEAHAVFHCLYRIPAHFFDVVVDFSHKFNLPRRSQKIPFSVGDCRFSGYLYPFLFSVLIIAPPGPPCKSHSGPRELYLNGFSRFRCPAVGMFTALSLAWAAGLIYIWLTPQERINLWRCI